MESSLDEYVNRILPCYATIVSILIHRGRCPPRYLGCRLHCHRSSIHRLRVSPSEVLTGADDVPVWPAPVPDKNPGERRCWHDPPDPLTTMLLIESPGCFDPVVVVDEKGRVQNIITRRHSDFSPGASVPPSPPTVFADTVGRLVGPLTEPVIEAPGLHFDEQPHEDVVVALDSSPPPVDLPFYRFTYPDRRCPDKH